MPATLTGALRSAQHRVDFRDVSGRVKHKLSSLLADKQNGFVPSRVIEHVKEMHFRRDPSRHLDGSPPPRHDPIFRYIVTPHFRPGGDTSDGRRGCLEADVNQPNLEPRGQDAVDIVDVFIPTARTIDLWQRPRRVMARPRAGHRERYTIARGARINCEKRLSSDRGAASDGPVEPCHDVGGEASPRVNRTASWYYPTKAPLCDPRQMQGCNAGKWVAAHPARYDAGLARALPMGATAARVSVRFGPWSRSASFLSPG